MTVDRFIRTENQESWDGSGEHANGDAWVHNFTPNPNEKFRCRRHTLTCNGIDKCQFLDPELFAGLERFEADENAMRELWNHELDPMRLKRHHLLESLPDIIIVFRDQNVQFSVMEHLSWFASHMPRLHMGNSISSVVQNGRGQRQAVISTGQCPQMLMKMFYSL
ncbi:hypothetical protein B0H14DRAFT_2621250 [Mycena olivaceomarginata]|nr:hypothetical protein B0H14DRAFT_2621250 [Mycena olivaceomarginata]